MSQAAADNRGARHYAILIGINSSGHESGTKLTGCVRDVEEMAKALAQSVEDVRIYSLTSTWDADDRPTEPKENWPTFNNISSCLLQVTQRARQGDYVYMHYSGHSTVVPPSGPHSNRDNGDLALVVLEGPTASEVRYFHGIKLAEHLKEMGDKGINATIVLDCCHSGSALRADEAVRYLPYDPEIDDKYPSSVSFAPSPPVPADRPCRRSSAAPRGPRRASIISNWLADPERYAILTSSDATEKAYEVFFDKSKNSPRHGTLTYFLLETFDMLGGVGGSMQQLYGCVSAKIQDHRRFHTRKKQRPVLLGNGRQLFFGCAKPGCSGSIPITRMAGGGGTPARLQLHAGSAHGIVERDRFDLYPLACQDGFPTTYTPVVAETVNIRGITSDLRILEGEEDAPKSGWLATATTRMSLRQFPVQLNVPDAHRARWQEALRQHVSLAEFKGEDEVSFPGGGGGWSFMIVQASETTCEIQDQFRQTVTSLTGVEDPERMRQQLLNQLQHLASFRLVHSLTNASSEASTRQFQGLFSIVLQKSDGAKLPMDFRPGCSQTGNLFDSCFHPECMVTMTPSERVHLEVHNKAGEHGSLLFVYVFAMACSDWEIEEMMKASRSVISPKGNRHGHEVKATGVFEMKIKFTLDGGQESSEDIVKVFVTAQPTSFTTLAMPKLGARGSYAEPVLSAKRGGYESEDWAAFMFRVRVAREEASN